MNSQITVKVATVQFATAMEIVAKHLQACAADLRALRGEEDVTDVEIGVGLPPDATDEQRIADAMRRSGMLRPGREWSA